MSHKKLKRLQCFPKTYVDIFNKHGIENCKEFLTRNILELMNYSNLDYYSVIKLRYYVSKDVAPKPFTLKDVYLQRQQSKNFIATSLLPLDLCLHGGLPNGTITEITGPPGVGKTQFCMMMAVIAAVPKSEGGQNGGVTYIDTEAAFSANRFAEILKSRHGTCSRDKEMLSAIANRVSVHQENTCEGLNHRLHCLEEEIIENQTKLVIVDSIASLIRKDYSTDKDFNDRNSFLLCVAGRLKYLAENFRISIIVTNQITTRQRERSTRDETVLDSYTTAALGNTWAHAVNTRLVFQFRDSNTREVIVTKSPVSGRIVLPYYICQEGLRMASEVNVRVESDQDRDINYLQIRTKPV